MLKLHERGTMINMYVKQYKIFQHPNGSVEAVKQGWSFPAAIFGIIWAVVKGLWMVAISILGVYVFVNTFIYDPSSAFIINVIVSVVLGVNGNNWRETNLLSRGYNQVDVVVSLNTDAAIAAYLTRK